MMPWQYLASPSVIQPLGWSLVHFLWQGAVVALLLAGYFRLLRPRSARTRYLAACAALALMAACPGLTLLTTGPARNGDGSRLLHRRGAEDAAWTQPSSVPTGTAFSVPSLPGSGPRRWPLRGQNAPPPPLRLRGEYAVLPAPGLERGSSLAATLEPLLPGLVVLWLAGVLLLSLRFLGGWLGVQRLGRRDTRPIRGPLEEQMAALARRLGIRRPVRLLESARVTVPTVIGWLGAVILLPAGALTGLTPAQLEALLAHELAHIRRWDYLVNLLQTAVETLLFYHPAVWWVSGAIRAEREHCCDDLAVDALGDRVTYAHALTALEELRSAPGSLALAGNGGDLMGRIRRIVGLPCRRAEPIGPWLAGTVALPLLLATGAVLRVSAAGESSPPVTPGPAAAAVAGSQARGMTDPARSDAGVSTLPDPRQPAASPAGAAPSLPGLAGAKLASPGPDRAGPLGPPNPSQLGPRNLPQLGPPNPGQLNPPNLRQHSLPNLRQPGALNLTAPGTVLARPAVMGLSGTRSPGAPQARIVLASLDRSDEDRSHLDLSGADLTRTDLDGLNLAGADLSGANLSGKNLSGKNLSRADLSGANLSRVRFGDANLSHADLSGATLTDADLSHARLSGADLSGANLSGVRLAGVDLSGVNLSGADLTHLDLTGVDLKGADLSGANLSGANLSGKDLTGTDLSGANLAGTRLAGARLSGTNLSGAHLDRTSLSGVDLTKVDLSGADLTGLDLRETNLSGADLSGANLAGLNLTRRNLSHADLSGANLKGARLAGADLSHADLSGANLADADLSHARLAEADLSGARLEGANLDGTDLSGVDLSGVNLARVDLTRVDLKGVDLSGADLSGANLSGKNLSGADLSGANLHRARLARANLSHADLSGADLTDADLSHARLDGADISGARLDGANLTGVDLSEAER